MKYIIISLCILFALPATYAQQQSQQKKKYTLTLEEVMDLARLQSTNAIQAKHTFRSSYWQFRSYKAQFLPSLVFRGTTPQFQNGLESIPQPDGTRTYQQVYSSTIDGSLSLNQNIPFTGGSISLSTGLQRYDKFGDQAFHSYSSSPLWITYTQSIFGVNRFKWDKKIEPLEYERAKRQYLSSMEQVSLNAIQYFFDLASAQQSVIISEFNYANNDTLFRISNGRYNNGTIGKDALLQSELGYMNARAKVNSTRLNLASTQNRLRSFLGFNENVEIEIIIPENVPATIINYDKILELSKRNSPDLITYQQRLINAERSVAEAKANRGFTADMSASFGLNPQIAGNTIPDAYKNLKNAEAVGISLRIPILDWGQGKGRVKMAQSQQDLIRAQVDQSLADFEQTIVLQINQFNQQDEQYQINAKSDTIAQLRYSVAKQRYLIDKITITDMNNAQNDRDNARQSYVSTLYNYWRNYYILRQATLFDLINNKPLEVDYNLLVE